MGFEIFTYILRWVTKLIGKICDLPPAHPSSYFMTSPLGFGVFENIYHVVLPWLTWSPWANVTNVIMTNVITWVTRSPAFSIDIITNTSCWNNNVGEGLLHACISSSNTSRLSKYISSTNLDMIKQHFSDFLNLTGL
jgi:hypothetical protein